MPNEKNTVHLIGIFDSGTVYMNNKLLRPERSLKIRKHSPDGFMWGYAGSGPAQLALAVLLEASNNPAIATANYQKFKADFIAKIPQANFDVKINLIPWLNEGGN